MIWFKHQPFGLDTTFGPSFGLNVVSSVQIPNYHNLWFKHYSHIMFWLKHHKPVAIRFRHHPKKIAIILQVLPLVQTPLSSSSTNLAPQSVLYHFTPLFHYNQIQFTLFIWFKHHKHQLYTIFLSLFVLVPWTTKLWLYHWTMRVYRHEDANTWREHSFPFIFHFLSSFISHL